MSAPLERAAGRDEEGEGEEEGEEAWLAAAASSSACAAAGRPGPAGDQDPQSSQLARIKQDILRSRRAVKVMTGEEAVKVRGGHAMSSSL